MALGRRGRLRPDRRPLHRGDQDRDAGAGEDRGLSGARHPAGRRRRGARPHQDPRSRRMGRGLERGCRRLHGQGQGGRRSEGGGRQFPARLAALLFRAVAGADFGRANRPPTSGRSRPISCTPRYFDPPLEVVRIPFEGSEIVGYLRLPANVAAPGAAGAGDFGAGQPQGDRRRDLCGGACRKASASLRSTVPAPDRPRSRPVRARSGCIPACSIIWLRGRRSTAAASSCTAKVSAPIGRPNSRIPRRSGWPAPSPNLRRSTAPSSRISSAAGCTPANICSTCVPASLYVYGLQSTDELLAFLPKMSLQAQGLLGKPTAPIFVVGGSQGHPGADRRSRTAHQ